jgi:hypothetical protein
VHGAGLYNIQNLSMMYLVFYLEGSICIGYWEHAHGSGRWGRGEGGQDVEIEPIYVFGSVRKVVESSGGAGCRE